MAEGGALLGAIELGGTKINLAFGRSPDAILLRRQIPTTKPEVTLRAVADALRAAASELGPPAALGVGSFGPIIINPTDASYGRFSATPKPGWSHVDLLGALRAAVACPIALATDVGAAGVGEWRLGALKGLDCGVYVTIGTGIGAAIIVRGAPIPALLHPEMGHFPLRRLPQDTAPGRCPFHGDCAEGLISGPAIAARFGRPLSAFAPDGPEMALAADYIGQLAASILLAVSPQRIVIGGGVGKTPGLHAAATHAMLRALNGYALHGLDPSGYLAPPDLGDDAGVAGALALAEQRLYAAA